MAKQRDWISQCQDRGEVAIENSRFSRMSDVAIASRILHALSFPPSPPLSRILQPTGLMGKLGGNI